MSEITPFDGIGNLKLELKNCGMLKARWKLEMLKPEKKRFSFSFTFFIKDGQVDLSRRGLSSSADVVAAL